MDISRALIADLRELGAELGGESVTTLSLTMLRRDLRVAVRSFLGFSLTMTVPGPAVSVALNVVDGPLTVDAAADWLSARLPGRRPGYTASITIFAGEAHALDGLREDLAAALDLAPAALRTAGRPATVIVPGISGLEEFSDVHRATGLLMGAGHTYETACVELIRQAHHHPGGMVGAAQTLLDDARSNARDEA